MTRRSLFKCITRQEPGNEVIWVDWLKTAGWLMSLCALLLLLQPLPAWGAPAQIERTPLTPELLQERLHTPILREGNVVVDLRQMVIDLRPENASFRDSFYQILRKELQKVGSKPLGLDLSRSLIQGDFFGSDLGLRTPLYAKRDTRPLRVSPWDSASSVRLSAHAARLRLRGSTERSPNVRSPSAYRPHFHLN